jgi:hypothetical protein
MRKILTIHNAATFITKVEFEHPVTPNVLLGRSAFLLNNIDFWNRVVCPGSRISSTYATLAVVDVVGLAWDFHCDGAAVAGCFDFGGHLTASLTCTFLKKKAGGRTSKSGNPPGFV